MKNKAWLEKLKTINIGVGVKSQEVKKHIKCEGCGMEAEVHSFKEKEIAPGLVVGIGRGQILKEPHSHN